MSKLTLAHKIIINERALISQYDIHRINHSDLLVIPVKNMVFLRRIHDRKIDRLIYYYPSSVIEYGNVDRIEIDDANLRFSATSVTPSVYEKDMCLNVVNKIINIWVSEIDDCVEVQLALRGKSTVYPKKVK